MSVKITTFLFMCDTESRDGIKHFCIENADKTGVMET
jgi:hypothetical protein